MSIFLKDGIERQYKSQRDKKKQPKPSSLSLSFGNYPPTTVFFLEKYLGNKKYTFRG